MLALPEISLVQMAMVGATAFFASVIGGIAGYGTGLLLPLALVPVIGAEATIPVISITAMITNAGRLFALRGYVDWRRAALMLPLAVPFVILSSWFFVRLDGRGATIIIGLMLMGMVPLRHILRHVGYRIGDPGLILAGGAFGLVTGISTGAGVILISFLGAAGLAGTTIIATDAMISLVIGIVKTLTFGALGALPLPLILLALIIGACTIPGAFVARWLLERLSADIHTLMLDATVLIGGAVMVTRAIFF